MGRRSPGLFEDGRRTVEVAQLPGNGGELTPIEAGAEGIVEL
jgi:hypothetical protein